MTSGEMLGRLHQQLFQFQPEMQPAGPPLETEIFIQLQERLSRLQSIVEGDLVSSTQIDSWIQEVEMSSKARWVHYTIRNTDRNGSYTAITAPKISSLMVGIFARF